MIAPLDWTVNWNQIYGYHQKYWLTSWIIKYYLSQTVSWYQTWKVYKTSKLNLACGVTKDHWALINNFVTSCGQFLLNDVPYHQSTELLAN